MRQEGIVVDADGACDGSNDCWLVSKQGQIVTVPEKEKFGGYCQFDGFWHSAFFVYIDGKQLFTNRPNKKFSLVHSFKAKRWIVNRKSLMIQLVGNYLSTQAGVLF